MRTPPLLIIPDMASICSSKPSALQPRQSRANVIKWLACAALIVCVAVLAVSVWTAASPAEAPASGAPSGQVVVEPGAEPSPEELAAADYLAGQGHCVRLLRRDPASPNPQPDAQLDDDDFPTEIKTVGNITSEEVDARLAGRIREALRQAPSVVVDARNQEGLTLKEIESAMRRGIGMAKKDGKVVKRVHVFGPHDVDINWDYT